MNNPLVSIGLPTYNRANDLRACLANLTSLDYKNIEIIISDNHSTDTTIEVCKEYLKKDKRIRYYRQKTNGGVNKNSLSVLEKAKGKYFFLASDDDIRSRTYLSELIPLLEQNPKATTAITDTTLFTKSRSFSIPVFFRSLNHPVPSIYTYLFHPECVSILFYGVHRRSQLFVDNFRRIMNERRPFGVLGYDDSLAIFLLSQGDLIYIPKNLFFIRDNGMYLSVYQNLSKFKLSRVFFRKTFQYLLFPIMFLCDLYYGSFHIYRSTIPFYLKPLLFIALTGKLLYDIVLFLYSIIKAVVILVVGFTRKLISYLALFIFRKIKSPQP
jgi:glycosyltransferase involved in cell wall biosynthesis